MANKKKSGSRAERLVLIAEDLALDMTEREIADKHDISPAQAHRDCVEIRRRWLEARGATMEQARAVQVARLTRFIREMWAAWFASKGWQFKLREEQVPGEPQQLPGIVVDGEPLTELLTPGEPVTVKSFKQSYYSHGSPKYAELILGAYDQLAKIDGLYAAKELTINVKRYLEEVAAELGIESEELLREAEEVAEQAWKQAEQAG